MPQLDHFVSNNVSNVTLM